MTKSINLKIIMESEEALAYYHMEYRDEVWFSMRESYPAIKEAALRRVKECSAENEYELKDIDEDLSGVVINRADEISTVVICTYEENGLFSFFHSFDRPDISFEVTYFCDRYTVRAKEFYASERLMKIYKTDMRSKAFFDFTREEQNAFLWEERSLLSKNTGIHISLLLQRW